MNKINLDGLDFEHCTEIMINGEVYCNKSVLTQNIPFQASLTLGKLHGGLLAIINAEGSTSEKMRAIEELEFNIRHDIEKLYYPMPSPSSPA